MPKAQSDKKAQPEKGEANGPSGKLGIMYGLLTRPEGATIAQLVEATGWLPHSVRGALAGSLKKKHGITISSAKEHEVRVYRAAASAAQ